MTSFETEPNNNALASQMLRGVFGVYLFIAIAVTGIHMLAEYLNTEDSIYQEMDLIHETFESGLAQSLWNMNDEQSQVIPQGILNLPIITRVQLLDHQGKILNDIKDKTSQENILTKSFDIYYFNRGKPNTVGTLILSSSRSVIFKKLRHGFTFILINAVIKSTALWLIFLWFGKRLIHKPLRAITHSIKKMDIDNLHLTTIPSPNNNKNEISTLTESFNSLILKLSSAKMDLDKIHQQQELEVKEHKIAKEEIAKINSVLDERVRLRTQELEQSQQEALQANLAKTQFLARMSHELRTPLNEVLGFAQVQERLLRKEGNQRQQETVQHILNAGHKLLRIIEDILNYSQMDDTADDITLEACDIDIAILEAIQQVNDSNKDSQVQINYSPSQLKAKSNLLKLMQVVTHIVSNAVKYNHKKGSVNIMCAIAVEGHIEIAIQDTGVGINKKYWKDIFSPFTRLEYAESHQIGGVGVGLSLARSLMKNMQGDIVLAHSSEDGSLFIINLPKSEDLEVNSQA
ncbi:hypothetical protein A9Q81_27760 [Gammaproteobacteria bacterium 42_54_T18]|nr:hypothetical protein A9Q81_27760 [Gammaproteobacteria bacterium 42_54_T18]